MAETIESSEFAPNDIILKRYSGEEKVFKGVDVVRLTHASNEYTVPYTFGEAVESIPITLDLEDGDQTVTAPEGTLVKSAVISKPVNLTPENIRSGKTIAGVTGEFVGESEPLIVGTSEGAVALDWSAGDQIITPVTDGKPFSPVTLEKPATLLPENIAEGIDIAGVIGTLSGKKIKYTVVQVAKAEIENGINTFSHDLGIVPDIIFFNLPIIVAGVIFAIGFSSAFHAACGNNLRSVSITTNSSGTWTKYALSSVYPIDGTTVVTGFHNVTDSSFSIGTDSDYLSQNSHSFVLIGGLT